MKHCQASRFSRWHPFFLICENRYFRQSWFNLAVHKYAIYRGALWSLQYSAAGLWFFNVWFVSMSVWATGKESLLQLREAYFKSDVELIEEVIKEANKISGVLSFLRHCPLLQSAVPFTEKHPDTTSYSMTQYLSGKTYIHLFEWWNVYMLRPRLLCQSDLSMWIKLIRLAYILPSACHQTWLVRS